MSFGEILPPVLFVAVMGGLYWGLTAIKVRAALSSGVLAILAAVGGLLLWRSGSHDWGVDPLTILAAFLCFSVAVVAAVSAVVSFAGKRFPGIARLRLWGLIGLVLAYVALGVIISGMSS